MVSEETPADNEVKINRWRLSGRRAGMLGGLNAVAALFAPCRGDKRVPLSAITIMRGRSWHCTKCSGPAGPVRGRGAHTDRSCFEAGKLRFQSPLICCGAVPSQSSDAVSAVAGGVSNRSPAAPRYLYLWSESRCCAPHTTSCPIFSKPAAELSATAPDRKLGLPSEIRTPYKSVSARHVCGSMSFSAKYR